MRETPGRRASAPPSFRWAVALIAIFALPLAGCPASPPPDPPPADSAPVPAPTNRPLVDGPRASIEPTPAAAPSADAPLTVVGAAHILVAYKGALGAAKTVTRTKADAKKRADEAHDRLVAHQGTFEELVAKFSDDDLSKPAGGKIGNFERNVFPPAFTEAAFGMAVGGISEVVETPRGFHVITRTK
ncbi:MAG: peptidylprolyl isomerase [Byssovorax sp.]